MQDAIHKKQKNKPSVLAVLVNFGTEQIEYLKSVVAELKSFSKYDVTVVVQSNIPLDMVDGIDTVNIVKLDNYQLLPLTCRKVIKDNAKNYDYFIYSENDHLWKESHVDKMIEYEKNTARRQDTGIDAVSRLMNREKDFTQPYMRPLDGKRVQLKNTVI